MIPKQTILKERDALLDRLSDLEDMLKVHENKINSMQNVIISIQIKLKERQEKLS